MPEEPLFKGLSLQPSSDEDQLTHPVFLAVPRLAIGDDKIASGRLKNNPVGIIGNGDETLHPIHLITVEVHDLVHLDTEAIEVQGIGEGQGEGCDLVTIADGVMMMVVMIGLRGTSDSLNALGFVRSHLEDFFGGENAIGANP